MFGWGRSGSVGFGQIRVGSVWFVWVPSGSCGFVQAQVGSIGFFGDDGDASLTFWIFNAVDFENPEFRQYLEDLLVPMSFYCQLYNPSSINGSDIL